MNEIEIIRLQKQKIEEDMLVAKMSKPVIKLEERIKELEQQNRQLWCLLGDQAKMFKNLSELFDEYQDENVPIYESWDFGRTKTFKQEE